MRELAAEIAGFINEVDQKPPDHAACRICHGQRELLREVIGKRRLHGEKGFDVVVAAVASVASPPFRMTGWPLGVRARRGRVRIGCGNIVADGSNRLPHAIGCGVTVFTPGGARRI